MPIKSNNKEITGAKYSNNVYIAAEPRKKLEKLCTEIGYERRKNMPASAFVRYLIENFGEQAKKKILKNIDN
ncbi:hypothetical protein F0X33_18670 [Salmonella enterica]|uniref:Uncharacterized protein n=7 Tax=Salmonella enterica TaxID=28901 RepID=A0A621KIC0_SALMU|nr:hypothetical protein [Salmonella enterica]EAA1730925.1 hypothetical protein [Salmonella enterica subsp. enterica serovar Oranienburg]EAA1754419.1 hypothetical protein [Salmonella enterica subsp. enterica serovar Sundsvall]EAA2694808.1 hypothetical protein [Salmonella enterica subsp. enterica serovar Typhimurium]EAA5369801.1 hypothetical protein [Salmonella enterica subsp. arizonae]EAA5436626.1 hypothetical protein [Salmonella enterica subsp. enterica serovar Muenchen]EAA5645009.1 hypotheti